jgi:hypothetical protein
MAEPLFINELIQKVNAGQIRIPSFQRGFVWDSDRVAHLMDSIYKGFPFGSLLFWRTKTPLKTERKLGPFVLHDRDPDYPLDYILDGQQRATSIFGVFQTDLEPSEGEDDSLFKIYFDLSGEPSAQDSNFIYVPDDSVDRSINFPLKLLFNPPEYRRYTRDLPEDLARKVDILYQRFTTARIPVQTFETDDRAAVAIVFERINRMGVELDTLQLLSAWSWSDDFDLQEQFTELADELCPFGFKDVGEDSDLLLRCCSAILRNDSSPAVIIELNGEEVRTRFSEIRNGTAGAIEFLRINCNAYSAAVLPFSNIIIPLSVFFSTNLEQDRVPTSAQRDQILKWIWRTFFSRRYSKRLEQLNDDIRHIYNLREGRQSQLGEFSVDLDETFFTASQFNLRSVNTKAFVLMLASQGPLSFISGSPVSLGNVLREANKKEFHHVFPRKYLLSTGEPSAKINSLVNFAMINRAENNSLGGVRPSLYRQKMPSNDQSLAFILGKSLCPDSLFSDDFSSFAAQRALLLVKRAYELMNLQVPSASTRG